MYRLTGEQSAAGFVDLCYNYLQERLQKLFIESQLEKLSEKEKEIAKVMDWDKIIFLIILCYTFPVGDREEDHLGPPDKPDRQDGQRAGAAALQLGPRLQVSTIRHP